MPLIFNVVNSHRFGDFETSLRDIYPTTGDDDASTFSSIVELFLDEMHSHTPGGQPASRPTLPINPSSPRTVKALPERAGPARKKHASAAGSQSDTGSAGHSSSSSGSSGSSVWDSLEDFKESKEPPTGPVPQFQEFNKGLIAIAFTLTEKPDDLGHLEDIVNRMYYAIRLSNAAIAKRTAAARDADIERVIDSTLYQLGLAPGSWVHFKAGDRDSSWNDTATPGYIRGLYRNAATPVKFDWDGVYGEEGGIHPQTTARRLSTLYSGILLLPLPLSDRHVLYIELMLVKLIGHVTS
ncbi:hypothetical protein BC826DRAFT_1109602 [Russula brevipes]|nr:hypothetical protein BC826DRAFT_1109602 [Russula brevipes]